MKYIFRISEWKDAHLLIFLTGILIWSYYYQIEFSVFIYNLIYLFLTAIFMGSFGYYINDVFDIQKDALAGKSNFATKHTPTLRFIIIFSLLFFSYIIWYFLCGNKTIFALLTTEVILLLLYSIPGIRLKERPVISVIVDALYAYVIGSVISIVICNPSLNSLNIPFLYIIWLLLLGMRGILTHHILDYYNDVRSNTITSATSYGINNILTIQKFILPPIEFIVFIFVLFNIYKPFVLIYVIYVILTFINNNNRNKIFNSYFLKPEVRLINSLLDNFYYVWLPVLFLILLTLTNVQYLFVLPFFIFFFFKRVQDFCLNTYNLLINNKIYEWIFRLGSLIVNYSLYYSFLVIGIDLKKRAALKAISKKLDVKIEEQNKTVNKFPVLSEIKEKKVNGLWIGGRLSNMELLTIHSFLDNGYEFYLWIYNELDNVLPKQVRLCDANEIIPADKIFTYKHQSQFGIGQGSVAGFSDIFRYKLLYEKGGWWVDMDITCLKPFDVEGDYFFRTHNSLDVVGNVIKAPINSLLMKNCYEQAIQTIDEENSDWHKPIHILEDNIINLNLKEHIYNDICNTDEFYKLEKYYFSDAEFPENWKFIHWNNETLRIYGIHKNYSFYQSTYSKLLRKYGLIEEMDDYSKMDKAFNKHLLIANLKKML